MSTDSKESELKSDKAESTSVTKQGHTPPQDHPWLNLAFNIILPLFLLNKGANWVGHLNAIILALSFPLCYGLFELIKKKKFNMFSIFGLINVLITGGLALSGKGGLWFAVKDAAFPGLIGLFVLGSSKSKKPFVMSIFLNPNIIHLEKLESKLDNAIKQESYLHHIRKTTALLSLSFFISAVLNFYLASKIFTPLDMTLSEVERSQILNSQIAKMTTTSMLVIMLPTFVFMMALFAYLFKGIKNLTGLNLDELMK